ncbi:MAG: alpha/beta fold hydrolase [Chlamydiota bacterium]
MYPVPVSSSDQRESPQVFEQQPGQITTAQFACRFFEVLTFIPRCILATITDMAIAAFCLLPLGCFLGRVDYNPKHLDPKKPHVLMIHGFLNNHTAFGFVRCLFQKAANLFAYNNDDGIFYNDLRKSIQDYTDSLKPKIAEIRMKAELAAKQNNTKKQGIHIIGHSLGGAIALALAAEDSEIQELTLITPLVRGSIVASCLSICLPFQLMKDMSANSPFFQNMLQRLKVRMEKHPLKIHLINSSVDLLIGPENARLPLDMRNIPGSLVQETRHHFFGHVGMLFSAAMCSLHALFAKRPQEVA